MTKGRVVAGIDGSPAAEIAIRWAATEAAARGAELHLVHAFVWPLFNVPLGASELAPGLRAAADRIVRQAIESAEKFEPGIAVEGRRADGFPAPVLIAASADADLVVIGSRGLGVTLGAMLGSTGLDLTANARCPVVVVRPDDTTATELDALPGPVVIGYDGSSPSLKALDFGLEYARRHSLPVRVVAARQLADDAAGDPEAELRTRYDGDDAEIVRVTGHPAEQILRLSADASLIVLGARGRGGFAGLLLGSVSQTVLQHATRPVAVIPAAAAGG
ncbi:universal stress protein [Kribbella sp. NPDC050124]|uniref:universal stress protein n=1 Tax=Kribbella sp. NPDC050124 TaxID=3364114 RepID=UPI00379D92BA